MIKYKNIYVIPIYHSRLNFCSEVRNLFNEIKPDAIAVELPESLRENVILGIKRLPKVSIIIYNEGNSEKYLFTPVDPSDSMIEGLRLAIENNISYYFIDLHIKDYSPVSYLLPDDQSIKEIGLKNFYELLKKVDRTQIGLDYKEFDGFPEFFTEVNLESVKNEYDKKIENYDDFLKDLVESNNESPTLDKAREYFMAVHLKSLMELHEKILFITGIAHWEGIENFLKKDNLNMTLIDYVPDFRSEIYNVGKKDIYKIFLEVPYFVYQYENVRERNPIERSNKGKSDLLEEFNKLKYVPMVFLRAIKEYQKRYDEPLTITQSIQLKQYLRNLVIYDGRLTPDVYHFIIAARSIVDDDYAWFVYKTANFYPFAVNHDEEIETITIDQDKFMIKGKKIPLRRKIPLKVRNRRIRLRKVREEKKGENWKEEWDKDKKGLCSWPKEDIILEERYSHIRKTGHRMLTEQFTKIHKFEGSILDGIDIRETIRNWVNGQNIYVKEIKRLEGDITDFIIIFDDEPLPPYMNSKSRYFRQKYPHNISFWAEHDEESDLAFFSTEPGHYLIGPGISVIKLGGLHSSFPPKSQTPGSYIWDVFDPGFNFLYKKCIMKSERLLLNAILQAKGKYILYIDKQKPRNYFYQMAKESGKGVKITYIPINMFSPSTLNRLKYMHVLAGRDKRKIAGDFIDPNRKFNF